MNTASPYSKFKALIFILTVSSYVGSTELPSAERINHLSELARLTTEVFFQQSFELRMSYEFSGVLLTETDRNKMLEICQRAVADLETIAEQQQKIKTRIENYEGPDWEHRFGRTGLWRKLASDLYKTQLALYEIDYYRALAFDSDERKRIATAMLINLKHLEEQFSGDNLKLLKARFITLEKAASDSKETAEELLNQITKATLLENAKPVRLWAMLEQAKLQKDNAILDRAVTSAQKHDFEGKNQWFMRAAFLYHRLGDYQKFERLLKKDRGLIASASTIILSQLEAGKEPLCRFEAELAAMAALQQGPVEEHAGILTSLAKAENFESSMLFYAAGLSLTRASPKKACELLVKASQLRQERKSYHFDIDAPTIAEQAGRLAYSLYAADSSQCEFAVKALRNYRQVSSDKMTEDLEYAYSQLLYECYDALEGEYILKRIAKASGKYSKKATLQLAAQQVRTAGYEDPNRRQLLLQEFAGSIENSDDCRYMREALGLVKGTLSKIEIFEDNPRKHAMMLHNAYKIADFFRDCSFGYFDDLVWAELAIITADANKADLGRAEEIIEQLINQRDPNEPDLLRCRARLLQKKRQFCKAAELWQKLAQLTKNPTPADRPNRQWWQAKYYELFCWLNCKNTAAEDARHAIDVLQASFDNIPAPWAEKLNALEQ